MEKMGSELVNMGNIGKLYRRPNEKRGDLFRLEKHAVPVKKIRITGSGNESGTLSKAKSLRPRCGPTSREAGSEASLIRQR